jgi:hypothetical protein
MCRKNFIEYAETAFRVAAQSAERGFGRLETKTGGLPEAGVTNFKNGKEEAL